MTTQDRGMGVSAMILHPLGPISPWRSIPSYSILSGEDEQRHAYEGISLGVAAPQPQPHFFSLCQLQRQQEEQRRSGWQVVVCALSLGLLEVSIDCIVWYRERPAGFHSVFFSFFFSFCFALSSCLPCRIDDGDSIVGASRPCAFMRIRHLLAVVSFSWW